LKHAHLVVTVSTALARDLAERGVDPDRILCQPNGYDHEVMDPARFDSDARDEARTRLGISKDAVVVMFVGTFGRWHGVEVLADAIRELATSHKEWLDRNGVRFVLVGDGLRMHQVRETLQGTAAAYTVLTGLVPQADTPAYLASADIAVSPHVANDDGTEFFGSPTKLFEYMGLGKAIVASDLGQIRQVLDPSLSAARLPEADPATGSSARAILARPGSVDELVGAIRFLVERPAWRSQIGANARDHATANYTWDRHVAGILAVIETALDDGGQIGATGRRHTLQA
jgi:glycosyltransferase involved in cell wall biosynthesis